MYGASPFCFVKALGSIRPEYITATRYRILLRVTPPCKVRTVVG